MRKLILVVAAAATFGAFSVAAEAMPINGAAAPAAKADANIQKTVVVIKKRGPMKRCKTVITAGRKVTKCVMR